MKRLTALRALALLLLQMLLAGAVSAAVPNPTVSGPIGDVPVRGFPYLDSFFDLSEVGYVEEEYFFSGTATPYGASTLPAPYTSRLIVRRPADPAKFNGTLIADWPNVTIQSEIQVEWTQSHDLMLLDGYAYVAISAQRAGICCSPRSLQAYDPARYGALTSNDVLSHPGDDYSFDIFSQGIQALLSPQGIDPMGGLVVERVIGAGQSQSASRLHAYVNQVQADAGIIDGFFIDASGNKTYAGTPLVPVIQFLSEGEASPSVPNVSQNYVLWEVAGASHGTWSNFWHNEAYAEREFAGADQKPASAEDDLHTGIAGEYGIENNPSHLSCIIGGNPFPKEYALNAAIDHLDRWIRTGVVPPIPPRFQFDSGGELARDADGNALGGLRLPPIDVPVMQYAADNCGLGGNGIPFTDLEIQSRYATHAAYVCQLRDATIASVQAGYMLPEGGTHLLSRANTDAARLRWTPLLEGVQDCDGDGIDDAIDNCPNVANPDQLDTGGIDTSTPDGIGNACQCGDVSGNGIVNGQDGTAIQRHGLGLSPNPLFVVGGNCDVTGNGRCNGQDGTAVRRAGLGAPLPGQDPASQRCQNADLFAPVCTNCD